MDSYVARENHSEIGNLLESLYFTLLAKRTSANWQEKLTTCSYLHIRDNYKGTLVPKRITNDSSSKQYFNTYRDGMYGYIMPSDQIWTRLLPFGDFRGSQEGGRRYTYGTESFNQVDQNGEALKILERMNRAVLQELLASNYYKEMFIAFTDLFATGTCYVSIQENPDTGKMHFRCLDPQEVVISENSFGDVDVYVRRMEIDAIDLVRMFPNAKLEKAREAVRGGIATAEFSKFHYMEAFLPKEYLYSSATREPIDLGIDGKWAYVVYVQEEDELVEARGMNDRFIFSARLDKSNDKSPYGTGLAESVLDDIVKLDDGEKNLMMISQRVANPPVTIPSVLKGKFSSKPGKENVVPDMSQKPEILDFVSSNVTVFLQKLQEQRQLVRNLLKADLFTTVMSSTDSRKTAYEVSERKNEALTLLSLQIASLNREFITPVYKKTLKHVIRKRASLEDMVRRDFSQIDRLIDENLEVGLDSVFVRRLQSYLNSQGTINAVNNIAGVMNITPESMLNFDWDSIVRKLAVGNGLDAEDLVAYGKVRQMKSQIANRQNEIQQNEAMAQQSKAAADSAKALQSLGIGAEGMGGGNA